MSVESLGTKADFDKCLKDAGDKVVAIEFMATWNRPCQLIVPQFEEMAKEFTNVICKKVDIDDNEETAQAVNLESFPTFKFFKNGEEIKEDQIQGSASGIIREVLKKHN